VCVPVTGRRSYYRAARAAVRSVLRHSDFDVFVALGDRDRWRPAASPRVHVRSLAALPRGGFRAWPFLLKLRALASCLAETSADIVVLLDADARFVARTDVASIEGALAGRALGMVEQTTILGSAMARADFLDHYVRHSLTWLGGDLAAPRLEEFRFFNSGVVLGRRAELERLTAWALARMEEAGDRHHVGAHMIADQDYLQIWTNSLRPGSCAALSWEWNHCEHWDAGFPRRGARIVHASNFCRGPTHLGLWKLELKLALARLGWTGRREASAPAG
jgi:hypothetical protein